MRRLRALRIAEAGFSIVGWIGIAILTVFWTVAMIPVWLLRPVLDPERRILHRMASLWGRGLVAVVPGRRVAIVGAEHLPRGRAVVLMANHQSYADVPLLFHVPGQFRWMADAPLFRIPVFGWAMRMAGYIPVERGHGPRGLGSLNQARVWLKKGISVFVFPEGTRSRSGVVGRFLTGGFRLAQEAGVPVVPIVVVGTRQLLPRGSWIFRWGIRLQIVVLPPVSPGSHRGAARQLLRRVREEMRRAYRERVAAYPGRTA